LRDEYAPKGRTEISVESLPDGKRRYAEAVKAMTTVDITPEAVHQVGLKEVARITAEMTKLAQAQGYKDLAASVTRSTTIRSGNRRTRTRSSPTSRSTSTRCSRGCRSSSGCCRSRR
jgi:uncharacterized protein (DUF885 family)